MGFPTKNDHFGVFWGYHHLRKQPYTLNTKGFFSLLTSLRNCRRTMWYSTADWMSGLYLDRSERFSKARAALRNNVIDHNKETKKQNKIKQKTKQNKKNKQTNKKTKQTNKKKQNKQTNKQHSNNQQTLNTKVSGRIKFHTDLKCFSK